MTARKSPKAVLRKKAARLYRRVCADLDSLRALGMRVRPKDPMQKHDIPNQAWDASEQARYLYWEVRYAITHTPTPQAVPMP